MKILLTDGRSIDANLVAEEDVPCEVDRAATNLRGLVQAPVVMVYSNSIDAWCVIPADRIVMVVVEGDQC